MSQLTKIVLIVITIIAFSLFITMFTYVFTGNTTTPNLYLGIGTLSFIMSVLLNEELIQDDIKKREFIEQDETFDDF